MPETKPTLINISKTLTKRYIFAFVTIILLIIIRQLIIQYQLSGDTYLSSIVNVSGKQRMLSQQIAKNAYAIYINEENQKINEYVSSIKKACDLWEKNQLDLKRGKASEKFTNKNSAEVMKLFEKIEPAHQAILKSAYNIIQFIESGSYSREKILEEAENIEKNDEIFLNGMNQIVSKYDQEAIEKMDLLKTIEFVLFIVLLGVIFFQTVFLFFPVSKRLKKAFHEITENRENLEKLFEFGHSAVFVIDEITFNIITLNQKAKDLVSKIHTGNHSNNFFEVISTELADCENIRSKIKADTRNDNIEIKLNTNDTQLSFLLSTQKVNFNKKPVLLVELFDITEQKSAEEALNKLAVTDRLTGLYNRHFIDSRITSEIRRADRYYEPISMIILDIDRFKNINDTWGHPVGDEVLKQLAQILSSMVRKTDILARMGGEEFAIFMPETNSVGAIAAANKIKAVLNQNVHPVVGGYTASFGVAQKNTDEIYESWYKRADEALYHAKQEGRNRVVCLDGKETKPLVQVHFDWKDEWNCGNIEIDQQHRELIDKTNSLLEIVLSAIDPQQKLSKMDSLVDFIKFHFEFEEKVLEAIDYPDLQDHATIHQKLISRAEELKKDYQQGELKDTALFTYVIDDVIVGHIIKYDKEYYPFLEK